MDRGPFRAQRPADKSATNRPELTPSQQSEDVSQPQQVAQPEESAPMRRSSTTKMPNYVKEKPVRRRFKGPVWLIAVIVAAMIVGGVVFWAYRNVSAGIDGSKYQAVFFTNGQVYFGKLHTFNSQYMKLTNIYYLQTQSTSKDDAGNPQQTTTDQNNVQLIKLGNEIHGPEDEMIVAKDQVLFYENLKPDSKVVQSINKFQKAD